METQYPAGACPVRSGSNHRCKPAVDYLSLAQISGPGVSKFGQCGLGYTVDLWPDSGSDNLFACSRRMLVHLAVRPELGDI